MKARQKKTTLYLAGPMRGIPEFNFPAFFAAEKRLVEAGFDVVNPARRDVDNGFQYQGMTGNEDLVDFDLAEALLWDLNAVAESDGVALLSGYSKSKGAQAEIALAEALGKPYQVVAQWLGDGAVFGQAGRERIYAPGDFDGPHGAFALGGQLEKIEDPYGLPKVDGLPGPGATMHGGAVKVTSATGGSKGKKLEELGSYDPLALQYLAKVAGFGAQKYAAFNYLKGYDWSLSYNALMRHLMAFLNGEDYDEESGLPHMAHVMWHAGALVSFLERGIGTDDRVSSVVGV